MNQPLFITQQQLESYRQHLREDEKSTATIEKYLRDVRAFAGYLAQKEKPVEKETVLAFKKELQEKNYSIRSINSMLAAVNKFLDYAGRQDCKVKSLKLQKQIYCAEEKELTKQEYQKLLAAAGEGSRLQLVMQTICGTGIRVSELKYFTVEAVKKGEVIVNCKSKIRKILIPKRLKKMLLQYMKKKKIETGVIFRNKKNAPLDRSMIWSAMKKLCKKAGVSASKVFPHNLRKLFARTFYKIEKDIAKLADILGHSSINTTRIYIMSTGAEHREKMDRLGLLRYERT